VGQGYDRSASHLAQPKFRDFATCWSQLAVALTLMSFREFMKNREWFRKTTWTESDREDFFAHLERSRKTSRAQYLRIQALYLYETKSLNEIEVALELCNLALVDYSEQVELASVLGQKAMCFNKLGKLQEAEETFFLAIGAMRAFRHMRPQVPFSFGLFVIEHKISRLYQEVLMILDEFESITDGIVFPSTVYYFCGIKAIILYRENYPKEARLYATEAIKASEKQYSGLSRHPKFGLVTTRGDAFYKELTEIAELC